jgi:hypothetical protein
MSDRERNSTDSELEELIEDLERLQVQLNNIAQRVRNIKGRRPSSIDNTKRASRKSRNTTLKIGDSVVVTNRYKGRKGQTGVVVGITATQVRLKPDNGEDEYRSYKANVKKIQE